MIAVGMPFCLAFLDQPVDEVVALWESWVDSGELVQARHEDPARDAVIRLRPSVLGVAEFIPNEPAFTLALNENPQLWMEAYDKKVVLMTPTNLISALRLALDLWQRKEQEDHITEIVNRGTALYDKVVNFCTNFDNLGKSVENLSKAYDTAHNQLTGNGGVTRQIEMLRQTSIQSKKRLPPSMLPLEESQP